MLFPWKREWKTPSEQDPVGGRESGSSHHVNLRDAVQALHLNVHTHRDGRAWGQRGKTGELVPTPTSHSRS